ncbi:MAG TPA: transcriptional regulator [Verrucomicrobiae bacterium]
MFRKDLIPMLLEHPMTVTEIARFADQTGKDTVEDLEHLLQSLKHTEYKPVVEVAECKKCGFQFGDDKLRKPGKCPKCKGSWITEPRIKLVRK